MCGVLGERYVANFPNVLIHTWDFIILHLLIIVFMKENAQALMQQPQKNRSVPEAEKGTAGTSNV